MGSRGISAVPIQDVAQVVLTHLRVPRDLKSTVRGILQWFPSLTGLVYILLSASRIIALYKGKFVSELWYQAF